MDRFEESLATAEKLFIWVFSIILFAGVAERFRRLPAEQLYMGSTPIPGFSA